MKEYSSLIDVASLRDLIAPDMDELEFERALNSHLALLRSILKKKSRVTSLGRSFKSISSCVRKFYRGDPVPVDQIAEIVSGCVPGMRDISHAVTDTEAGVIRMWGPDALSAKIPSSFPDLSREKAVIPWGDIVAQGVDALKNRQPLLPTDLKGLFPRSLSRRKALARVILDNPLRASSHGVGADGPSVYVAAHTLSDKIGQWYVGSNDSVIAITDKFHLFIAMKKEIENEPNHQGPG